jgi:hypothetical protein
VSASRELPPDVLERLRRSGLRIDRQGRLWHEGGEVTHARLRRALLRWLDRDADGRVVVRFDRDRFATVEVEDAELIATSARWSGDRAFLLLSDGSEEELDYRSLAIGDDHALYCRVRGGRLEARLAHAAHYAVAERIEEVEDGYRLAAAGGFYAIDHRRR